MSETLLDKGHVAGSELFGGDAAVRAENGHARAAFDVVLPLVGVWVPMHLADRARLEVLQRAGERGLDREFFGGYDADLTARVNVRLDLAEAELVRELVGVRGAAPQILRDAGRHLAKPDVHLALGNATDNFGRETEVLGGDGRIGLGNPVGDAESPEFGEVAVVEDQDEVRVFGAETLDRMAVALGEIPDVAGAEIGRLGLSIRHDHGPANVPLDHVGPFGRDGVPVQLAQSSGLEAHGDARYAFGNRELFHGRLSRRASLPHPPFRALDVELEVLQRRTPSPLFRDGFPLWGG